MALVIPLFPVLLLHELVDCPFVVCATEPVSSAEAVQQQSCQAKDGGLRKLSQQETPVSLWEKMYNSFREHENTWLSLA